MASKILKYIKNNKLLTKFAAVFSLFAIGGSAVEARAPKSSPAMQASVKKREHVRKISTRKARVARVTPAKTQRVTLRQARQKQQRVVSAPATPPVSRGTRARQGKQVRLTTAARVAAAQEVARQEVARQEAARVAAAQEVTRQEAARVAAAQEVARQEAARVAVAQEVARQEAARVAAAQAAAHEEFMHRAFDNVHNFQRMPTGIIIPENYPAYDLGYQGRRARTDQYAELHLPTTTVFHPYNPTGEQVNGVDNERGYQQLACLMNVKLPGYDPRNVPPALHANLAGIAPENIDAFLVVQDMPWIQGLRDLLLRPQYGLDPGALDNNPVPYGKQFNIEAGVFSNIPNGPRINALRDNLGNLIHPEQPADGLVQTVVSTHNSVDQHGVLVDPKVISSGANLPVRLDLDRSQILYSLTKKIGNGGVVEQVHVVTHVLLNQNDQLVLQGILQAAPIRHLQDIEDGIRAARVGGHFADLNLEELPF